MNNPVTVGRGWLVVGGFQLPVLSDPLAEHLAGLRGEVSVWSFDGFDYFWAGSALYCARQKEDVMDEKASSEDEQVAGEFMLSLIAFLLVVVVAGLVTLVTAFVLGG